MDFAISSMIFYTIPFFLHHEIAARIISRTSYEENILDMPPNLRGSKLKYISPHAL